MVSIYKVAYLLTVLNLMTNHIRSYEEKQTALLQAKIDEIMAQVREASEVSSINAIKK